jgi:hypothetical protein
LESGPQSFRCAPLGAAHRFAPLRGFQNRPYAKWPAPARLQARQSPPYARCRVLPGRSLAGLPLGARRLVNQRLRRVGFSCALRASNGGVPPARPSRAASRLRQARGGPVRPPEGAPSQSRASLASSSAPVFRPCLLAQLPEPHTGTPGAPASGEGGAAPIAPPRPSRALVVLASSCAPVCGPCLLAQLPEPHTGTPGAPASGEGGAAPIAPPRLKHARCRCPAL